MLDLFHELYQQHSLLNDLPHEDMRQLVHAAIFVAVTLDDDDAKFRSTLMAVLLADNAPNIQSNDTAPTIVVAAPVLPSVEHGLAVMQAFHYLIKVGQTVDKPEKKVNLDRLSQIVIDASTQNGETSNQCSTYLALFACSGIIQSKETVGDNTVLEQQVSVMEVQFLRICGTALTLDSARGKPVDGHGNRSAGFAKRWRLALGAVCVYCHRSETVRSFEGWLTLVLEILFEQVFFLGLFSSRSFFLFEELFFFVLAGYGVCGD